MTTAEHPITRAELRGEIDDLLHREFADLRREFREHYATKEDLAKLETRLIKWIVGQMIAAIVAASAVAVVVQQILD